MLLAEELECDWKKIRTEFPGIDRAFGNQGIVGSQSIRTTWDPLRKAGASAREMLIQAAAQKWGGDRSSFRAQNSTIIDAATGAARHMAAGRCRCAGYLSPTGVPLKNPKQYKIIGTSRKRLDTPDKVIGKATSESMCACPVCCTRW